MFSQTIKFISLNILKSQTSLYEGLYINTVSVLNHMIFHALIENVQLCVDSLYSTKYKFTVSLNKIISSYTRIIDKNF